MYPHELVEAGIKNFSENEIIDTGANLEDVKIRTFVALQKFRDLINRPVYLLLNGITTGEHKSQEHKDGKAVDICFDETIQRVNVFELFKFALQSEFKGIGIYHNRTAYSVHLDIGDRYRFWSATKSKDVSHWIYSSLIVDPKEVYK